MPRPHPAGISYVRHCVTSLLYETSLFPFFPPGVGMIVLPFGVAAGGIGVFRRLPSGIDAIDLCDGHRLWTSPEMALPITIGGTRVLARRFWARDSVVALMVFDGQH